MKIYFLFLEIKSTLPLLYRNNNNNNNNNNSKKMSRYYINDRVINLMNKYVDYDYDSYFMINFDSLSNHPFTNRFSTCPNINIKGNLIAALHEFHKHEPVFFESVMEEIIERMNTSSAKECLSRLMDSFIQEGWINKIGRWKYTGSGRDKCKFLFNYGENCGQTCQMSIYKHGYCELCYQKPILRSKFIRK